MSVLSLKRWCLTCEQAGSCVEEGVSPHLQLERHAVESRPRISIRRLYAGRRKQHEETPCMHVGV